MLPLPKSIQGGSPRYDCHRFYPLFATTYRVWELSHRPVSIFPGSVGLVSRFGQFYKAVDPGLVQVNVCTEALRIVDVKIQIISIGRQTVITRDNVNVEM
jgi:hypothetical protein